MKKVQEPRGKNPQFLVFYSPFVNFQGTSILEVLSLMFFGYCSLDVVLWPKFSG